MKRFTILSVFALLSIAGSAQSYQFFDYGMAEGNLAMLMLRTADHLRHTANLNDVFPNAASTAREAIGLVMRPPVVEEKLDGAIPNESTLS